MRSRAELFADCMSGHRLDVNPAFNALNSGQCVNLVNLWAVVRGHFASPGDARDLHWPNGLWVPLPPGPGDRSIPDGAIVIWKGPPAALPGHTAVKVGDHSDRGFWALSEDWPIGSVPHRRWFTWEGVAGWWCL